ncbi:MAG TPA: MarR family transcriptional regulator [Mycobacteriales bacterium]|jgi:DNA-binding MarR family transcriptional regulator|nr:MarR family transcriptional regulator [Mycobacteriales bacterium]
MVDIATDRSLVNDWRELLARHATISCALERELHGRHGLGMSEFEVLDRLVGTAEDKHRVQELADAVHLSQSALSRVIGRLEREGLVSRSLCDQDRRGIWVCLTDEGRDRHTQAQPTQQEVLAELLHPSAVG